jgi:hypothetical protein
MMPLARALVEMESGATIWSTKLEDAVCGMGAAESVTCTLKFAVPAGPVGVPVIAPEDAFKLRPAGSEPPVMLQVYVPVPPLAARACEYAVPISPLGSGLVVVMVSAKGVAVILACICAESAGVPESTTWTVNV